MASPSAADQLQRTTEARAIARDARSHESASSRRWLVSRPYPSGAWQFPSKAPPAFDYVAGAVARLLDPSEERTPTPSPTPSPPAGIPAATSIGSAGKTTLHDEIMAILRERGRRMTTQELADAVNERGNYVKQDGPAMTPFQTLGRAKSYPHLFRRDGGRIRLFGDD